MTEACGLVRTVAAIVLLGCTGGWATAQPHEAGRFNSQRSSSHIECEQLDLAKTVVKRGRYYVSTGRIELDGDSGSILRGPSSPVPIWQAIPVTFLSWHNRAANPGPHAEAFDWGRLCGSPIQNEHQIQQFTFGYATGSPTPGNLTIWMYWDFDPTCTPGPNGNIAGRNCLARQREQFVFTGLPADTNPSNGSVEAYYFDAILTPDPLDPFSPDRSFTVPAGEFAYSYSNWTGWSAPPGTLGTGELLVLPDAALAPGTEDGFDLYSASPQTDFVYWATFSLPLQFYFQVFAADVPPPVTPPQPPTTMAPGYVSGPGELINTLTPTMHWQVPSGASVYGLYISEGPLFTTLVYDNESILNRTSFTIPRGVLQPGTEYRWNMRASNGSCGGGWSEGFSERRYFRTDSPPPSNDNCANAITVGVGSAPFSTWVANTEYPPLFVCDQPTGTTIGADVWFNYIATADGTLSVDTCGSSLDTVLVVYSGATCPVTPARQMACNDDGCGLQAALSVPVSAGAAYKIRVGGYNGAVGTGTLRVIFTPGSPCANGLVRDCNGNCAPVSWVGDGLCDNGFYAYYGVPINFNCQQLGHDGGDCIAPPPPLENPPNRDEHGTLPDCELEVPGANRNKLILIVHGANTQMSTFSAFWSPLADKIRGSVSDEWQVIPYNWTSLSQEGTAETALANAQARGDCLGRLIAQRAYQHVHFIAHSAGAALIATAAAQVAATDTTVHTTYLDPYGGNTHYPGVGDAADAYGAHADWSDHYFTRDELFCGGTGPSTALRLPLCFSVDVSQTDPQYGSICGSSHSWPRCFYAFSAHGHQWPGSSESWASCASPTPDGISFGYGFDLSYERWGGMQGYEGWKASRVTSYGANPGDAVPLGGGTAAASMIYDTSTNLPFQLDSVPRFSSNATAVQATAGLLTMTTQPPDATESSPAWINFQITTMMPVNFVCFNLEFTGEHVAAGLLTVYVNGTKCGLVNEPWALSGSQYYRLPTPGELPPGEHYLSFRLDHFNQLTSSVTIENIATGFGEFVPACRADFDGNGMVQVPDIFAFLSAWFALDPRADFDGVPGVTVPDIFAFLSAWFAGCA